MWWPWQKEPDARALAREIRKLKAQQAIQHRDDEYRMQVMGMHRTWSESHEDNVDATHPITIDVYIPPNTKHIQQVLLRLRLKQFRAYSKATSASEVVVKTSGGSVWFTGGGTSGMDATDRRGTHTHTINIDGVDYTTDSGGGHQHIIDVDHNHEVEIPEHFHEIEYGIFEDAAFTADAVTVSINGIDRTDALSGPFNADAEGIDITQYLAATGWNTIVFTPGVSELNPLGLGRIQATVFLDLYIPQ